MHYIDRRDVLSCDNLGERVKWTLNQKCAIFTGKSNKTLKTSIQT